MKKRYLIPIAIFFVFGLYLGFLINNISVFELNKKIDIVALGNLILVVALAIIIPLYITNRLGDKRSGKDLLIEELAILCLKLEKIDSFLQSKSISKEKFAPSDFVMTISLFKSVRQHYESIQDILLQLEHPKVTKETNELNNKTTHYWNAVTGTNGIKKNDNYTLKTHFVFSQNLLYQTTQSYLRKLKFSVNKA